MEEKQRTNVLVFSWGSLPADALNQNTMRRLQLIADRRAVSIEQVISGAWDWMLGTPGAESRIYANVNPSLFKPFRRARKQSR
jgi:hypothetical protein